MHRLHKYLCIELCIVNSEGKHFEPKCHFVTTLASRNSEIGNRFYVGLSFRYFVNVRRGRNVPDKVGAFIRVVRFCLENRGMAVMTKEMRRTENQFIELDSALAH